MPMIDIDSPRYEPQPDDEYFYPQTSGETGVKGTPVNLSAVTYYAKLGMKPKRIAVLVDTSTMTIWNNNRLRQAYENGAAEHELWLRAILMNATFTRPNLAVEMLPRAAGKVEDDLADGMAPDEVQKSESKPVQFTITVETNSDNPKVKEIEKLLNDRIAEANQKAGQ